IDHVSKRLMVRKPQYFLFEAAKHTFFILFFYSYVDHRHLHSFPTRRSSDLQGQAEAGGRRHQHRGSVVGRGDHEERIVGAHRDRSEEHTSELQSLAYLVCRLLLEKKKARLKYCSWSCVVRDLELSSQSRKSH